MKRATVNSAINIKKSIPLIIYNVFALAIIYLVPTFSHLFNIPLYFIEPMRLMVIIAMVYTHRNNAYILAATLPLFSFFITMHPLFVKSIIISIELLFMVWLFYYLSQRLNNFISIFISIVTSKLLYYGIKLSVFMTFIPKEALVAIPLYIQFITTIFLSVLFYSLLNYKK